jgi:hypothetical protein
MRGSVASLRIAMAMQSLSIFKSIMKGKMIMKKKNEDQEVADSVALEINSNDDETVIENTEIQEQFSEHEYNDETSEVEESETTESEQIESPLSEVKTEEQNFDDESSKTPVRRGRRTYTKKTTTQESNNSSPATRSSYIVTYHPNACICFISLPQNININIYHHYNCKNN